MLELSASTSRIEQFGQAALTMSRSSAISWPQPAFTAGGVLPPRWFTFRKQPLAVVQAGRPYLVRYVARSASAVGKS